MDPASKQAAKYKTAAVLGIINDKLEVGMAKIRGEESAAHDVAIIKATLQEEVVPKEKHVRTLKIACTGSSPRQTVNYVIHGLAKRLEENPKAWLVTLKTLIVFHRLMRETDPTFQEELLRYAERTGHHRMLRLESFADHTTKETWDLSAWIRVYSLYLDERLAVFRSMRFDPEQDQGLEARESKLKSCSAQELLEHLPAVQRLLGRLVSCVPEGAAQGNEVALLACSLVLKEVRSVYKVVSEGVLNLVDRIFEMDRGDALKGVELVKENLAVNERLNAFVSTISNIPPLRGAVQFPTVQPLPSDFLTTLEDYIKDAPRAPGDTASKPVIGRSGSTAQRGLMGTSQALGGTGPRLIVGGPIKDPPSGPTSPQPLPAPTPTAAPVVDLLGFDSLSIAPTPPAPAVAPPPAAGAPGVPPQAPAAAPFDPFAGFGGAPAQPAALPPPPQPAVPAAAAPPPHGAPPPPYPYGQASSFANPTTAAAAAGAPFCYPAAPAVPLPSPSGAPPASAPFGDSAFGGGNAFAAPQPPAFPPPPSVAPGPLPPVVPPIPAPAPPPAAASAPFNPFANPSMHATVAPHMPAPTVPAQASAFAAQPATHAYQAPQAAAPAAPPPQLQTPVFADAFTSPGTQSTAPVSTPTPAAAVGPANPFSSPSSAAAAAPANPFGAAPTAPAGGGMFSSTTPFAQGAAPSTWPGPTQTAQQHQQQQPHGAVPGMGGQPAANPFGAAPSPSGGAAAGGGMFSPNAPLASSTWPAPAPAPVVVTQQVAGYNLKKPADPLMDLSVDLFGKPQAPPTQQPMRPQAGIAQNGGGSPGAPF